MATHTAKVFADIDISLDGFVAGEHISKSDPLGKGGEHLIWYGDDVNDDNADFASAYDSVDAEVLEESSAREGAVIMGRNTFDISIEEWGETPPIHKPCFVLTHRPTQTISKDGGTTFTFVSDLRAALEQAQEAAAGRDVGVMGGAETIRQYLAEGLLDELHLHVAPVLLGGGTRLFDNITPGSVHLEKLRVRDGAKATHLLYQCSKQPG
ncbi:dihydrofolate reductase [Natronospirillum operosum]|uniref:Dihydrofolate reductase n=1 Tax=Natronospirillum operosum TaxID=2759953 RepID=A0A4Z0W6H6_9GAMM|nr:dihydrofolate reductase family protein [Natronospirillum operosum]TGG91743.1 dihydrofolate reductase [Natronospirillum operosum]